MSDPLHEDILADIKAGHLDEAFAKLREVLIARGSVASLHVPGQVRRTQDEIMRDLMSGNLDIADLNLTMRVQIDEIDKSGDDPKMTRTRVYENGVQCEVVHY